MEVDLRAPNGGYGVATRTIAFAHRRDVDLSLLPLPPDFIARVGSIGDPERAKVPTPDRPYVGYSRCTHNDALQLPSTGWSGPHLPPRTSVAGANARTGPDISRGLFVWPCTDAKQPRYREQGDAPFPAPMISRRVSQFAGTEAFAIVADLGSVFACPGADAGDAFDRDVHDSSGRRVVEGRELDVGSEVDVREVLEQLRSTALVDSRDSFHEEILLQAGRLDLRPLDKQRDPRVALDVLQLVPAPRWASAISSPSSPTQTIEICGEPSGLIVTRWRVVRIAAVTGPTPGSRPCINIQAGAWRPRTMSPSSKVARQRGDPEPDRSPGPADSSCTNRSTSPRSDLRPIGPGRRREAGVC